MAHPRPALVRATLGGLAVGLALGAAGLLWAAWTTAEEPCAAPDTPECVFDVETAHAVAKLQLGGAAGCALVAAGLWLALRARPEK